MKQIIFIIVLLILVGCIGIAVINLVKSNNETTYRLEKLDEFCAKTRMGVNQDRQAFESDDPLRREAAYERFYDSDVIYHNTESMLMCLDNLPKLPLGCNLNKNWSCLADVAREIETQLRKTP